MYDSFPNFQKASMTWHLFEGCERSYSKCNMFLRKISNFSVQSKQKGSSFPKGASINDVRRGEGGSQKAGERNKIRGFVTVTRGEGVKKSKKIADIIYGSPLNEITFPNLVCLPPSIFQRSRFASQWNRYSWSDKCIECIDDVSCRMWRSMNPFKI